MTRVVIVTAALLAAAACKKNATLQESSSAVQDFAYKADARNFAVLAGSDGSTVQLGDGRSAPKLAGVPPDIGTWWTFLCPDQPLPAGGVPVPQSGGKAVTCRGILGTFEIVYVNQATTTAEELKTAMRWVGANLQNDSTLLLAYSGHGSEAGTLYVNPETPWWPFGDILGDEPRRRGVRGARFYFFNDSCYSGKLVNDAKGAILMGGRTSDGTQGQILTPALADGYTGPNFRAAAEPAAAPEGAVGDSFFALAGARTTAAQDPLAAANRTGTEALARDVAKGPAFAQAIIFSAATLDQVAGDLGAGRGGAFTSRLREVFEFYAKHHKPGDPSTNPSLQRVFNDIAWRVETATYGPSRQLPQYRVAPDCVLQEKFFITGKATTCRDAIGGTGAAKIEGAPAAGASPTGTPDPKAN